MRLNIRTETGFSDGVISTQVLTTTEELQNFYNEWLRFWKFNNYSNPFNAPQWLIPWWEYFGEGNPYLLIIRKNKDLTACFPFYIFTASNGERQLKLIGTGNSDYLDVLISTDASEEILYTLLKFINRIRNNFDMCIFHGQRNDSFLMKNLIAFSVSVNREDVSPFSELPPSFDEFVKNLSVQFRKNTQRALKLLSSNGFGLYKSDEDKADEFLSILIEMHNSEWNLKNLPGVLSDNKVQSFLRETINNFMKTGNVKLYALKSENTYAALNIIFTSGNTAYFYIGGYNREFQKFSPGSALLWKIIEDCIENGITRFDFLKGSEYYKYKWGAEDIPVNRIILYPDSKFDQIFNNETW